MTVKSFKVIILFSPLSKGQINMWIRKSLLYIGLEFGQTNSIEPITLPNGRYYVGVAFDSESADDAPDNIIVEYRGPSRNGENWNEAYKFEKSTYQKGTYDARLVKKSSGDRTDELVVTGNEEYRASADKPNVVVYFYGLNVGGFIRNRPSQVEFMDIDFMVLTQSKLSAVQEINDRLKIQVPKLLDRIRKLENDMSNILPVE